MRYKIHESVVCGVVNPSIVIRGWVEKQAEFIIIKSHGKELSRKRLKATRSQISNFHFSIPVNKNRVFDIYFVGKDFEEKIETLSSTMISRIYQKYQPRKNLINRAIKSIAGYKDHLKKLQEYDVDTFDLKNNELYNQWLIENQTFDDYVNFKYQPKISIVMPVYNVPGEYLQYCINSILEQTYQNFEICIADDCSTNQSTIDTLKYFIELDSRIKVIFREENGHISNATNSALTLATGEFIGLMDNDDVLEKHALQEVVKVLNDNKKWDFIYTDEDKIDMQGNRSDPHFKSDFSLDSLFGGNYICHFSLIRKTLIDKIGGFRVGYEGAQDFDLFLRLTDVTTHIYHIPKILYHWRMIPGSTAVGGDGAKNYAGEAGKRALEDYFYKKSMAVNIEIAISTHYFVEYLLESNPLVQIIIVCTNGDNVSKCLNSIETDTRYSDYKIAVVGNHTCEITDEKIDVVKEENINTAINKIVQETDAEVITFIDENSVIQTVDWLDIMIGYASISHIGIIGAKIFDKYHIVRESGITFKKAGGYMPVYFPTFRDDYGYNGRLLSPYNYMIVSHRFCALSKSKFTSLNDKKTFQEAMYDLCITLYKQQLSNVFIPQIEVINTTLDDTYESQLQLLENQGDHIEDPYYNSCLSKIRPFRVDKSSSR